MRLRPRHAYMDDDDTVLPPRFGLALAAPPSYDFEHARLALADALAESPAITR